MENILKDLMSKRCIKMHEDSKCRRVGRCDGTCADFYVALAGLEEIGRG